MTVKEAYNRIIEALGGAGIADSEAEARIIMRETAHINGTDLHIRSEEELAEETANKITDIIKRRLMREPLQYIYGSWNFMGLDFCVGRGALIPRPDTEILVETVMKEMHDGMSVLDLCTGTGCIILSLINYSNGCMGTGVDISEEALGVARQNARLINGADIDEEGGGRVQFLLGDLYEGTGVYDIIVSNPPYIQTDVIQTLEPEVKDYEPQLALDGGADGLDIIRRIIDGAGDHLIKGGSIFLEIGYDQGAEVKTLMEGAGFADVEVIKDYAGKDRVVRGRIPIL